MRFAFLQPLLVGLFSALIPGTDYTQGYIDLIKIMKKKWKEHINRKPYPDLGIYGYYRCETWYVDPCKVYIESI